MSLEGGRPRGRFSEKWRRKAIVVEDSTLVAQTLGGSHEAFREIVGRYQMPVFRLLVRMVRDEALAEDLAQETFVKAYRALSTYDTARKLASWLFKIAHNTAIDHLRRGHLETVSLTPEDDASYSPLDRVADTSLADPDAVLQGRDLARDLTDAVAALDPMYRELVLLRFQEGLPYQEIAEITDLPMGTVKVRLHRGRKQLAELLARRGWA